MRITAAILLLAACAAAPAAAADKHTADKTDAVPEGRCFCIQYTGGIVPYFLGRVNPPPPGCEGMKFEARGRTMQEMRLAPCPALAKCEQKMSEYDEKLKVLDGKTAEAKKQLGLCCKNKDTAVLPETGCDDKCTAGWERILIVLAKERVKQEAEKKSAWTRCFTVARNTIAQPQPPAEPVK